MAKEAKKTNNVKKEKKGNFLKEFKAELKRVSWPTFKQLVNNTTAVIAIVLLTAVIVFVLDVIFENLNNYGVGKLKALVTSSQSSNEVGDNTNINDVSNEADETSNTVNNEVSNEVNLTNEVETATDANTVTE
ncbi:MAG: preprotein translocase subunit SecE [Clostridia bacterium]|jgi:preprotein translocase subunit SecE|nr:preprotein translocase subunit SecE [Clostridia bacterium]